MMAKIRINLQSREFEIQGDEDFINKYDSIIGEYLNIIKVNNDNEVETSSAQRDTKTTEERPSSRKHTVPEEFGEFYQKFPKSINNVDKILIAGYFLQETNADKVFNTREASSLLVGQNVKLSNAAAFLKANLDTRKVFKVGKNYKVSESGIQYVNELGSLNEHLG